MSVSWHLASIWHYLFIIYCLIELQYLLKWVRVIEILSSIRGYIWYNGPLNSNSAIVRHFALEQNIGSHHFFITSFLASRSTECSCFILLLFHTVCQGISNHHYHHNLQTSKNVKCRPQKMRLAVVYRLPCISPRWLPLAKEARNNIYTIQSSSSISNIHCHSLDLTW